MKNGSDTKKAGKSNVDGLYNPYTEISSDFFLGCLLCVAPEITSRRIISRRWPTWWIRNFSWECVLVINEGKIHEMLFWKILFLFSQPHVMTFCWILCRDLTYLRQGNEFVLSKSSLHWLSVREKLRKWGCDDNFLCQGWWAFCINLYQKYYYCLLISENYFIHSTLN